MTLTLGAIYAAPQQRREEGSVNIKDKVAIITGAGGGIGRAICLRLADEGATVAVTDPALGPMGGIRK